MEIIVKKRKKEKLAEPEAAKPETVEETQAYETRVAEEIIKEGRKEEGKEEEKREEEIKPKWKEIPKEEFFRTKEDIEEAAEMPEAGAEIEEMQEELSYESIEIVKMEDIYHEFRMRKFPKPKKVRPKKKEAETEKPQPILPSKITIGESIRVGELSRKMGIKASEIIAKLLELDIKAKINDVLDFETASIIAESFGLQVEKEVFDEAEYIDLSEDRPEDLTRCPPVVTVMGHVDHGKTTLLDFIRKTRVADSEIGGITQRIGAYNVNIGDERSITFIDTPGHEAFTTMRARGAKVTDIVILVVAADDGVMPQTIESINHARAAGVPIVVAINKIDKPDVKLEAIKNRLAELGLIPEEWGGDTLFAEISAKTGQGVDELLEKIWLQTEMLDVKANPNRKGEAVVLESRLDKALGPVMNVIVKRGTLKKDDVVVVGTTYGKIRMIKNDRGELVKEVKPDYPAEVAFGGDDIPPAGEKVYVVESEEIAKMIAGDRMRKGVTKAPKISLEELYRIISDDKPVVNFILKADSQGALEAFEKAIMARKPEKIEFRIIHKGIGTVTESDVMLASASKAIVMGFNVKPDKLAQDVQRREKVDVRTYRIIYEAVEDIEDAAKGALKPKKVERVIGRAKVLKVFKLKVGKVAGCLVEDGVIKVGCPARLKRDGDTVWQGKIASLKRFKDFVSEVESGIECGVALERADDIKENDVVECYEVEEISLWEGGEQKSSQA